MAAIISSKRIDDGESRGRTIFLSHSILLPDEPADRRFDCGIFYPVPAPQSQ